ncbi:MAG: hypothetical protein J3R72DRAFT_356628, partial [Linnemannia gamsii]
LKVHSGAVELSSLSSRHPAEIMFDIKMVVLRLGIEIRSDSDFKIKCVRRKRKTSGNSGASGSNSGVGANAGGGVGSGSVNGGAGHAIDSGEEIRFSIELCRMKNLRGLYSVDIRRVKGNRWAYKFLYHAIL